MKTLVIFNPAAGPKEARFALSQAVEVLRKGGWRVEVAETTRREEAIAMSRDAAFLGYDVVVAAGGDGTVGEVVNGITGSETALGVLPLGTGNVWARQVGFTQAPLFLGTPNAVRAAELLLDSQVRRVDVGQADDRLFLLWTGIGIDARVSEEVESHPGVKRRLGPVAFVAAGVITAVNFVGTRAEFYLNGDSLRSRVILVIVSNVRLYAGLVEVAPYARLDDGLLDVCIFKGYGLPQLLRHVYGVFSGKHVRDPLVEIRQVSSMAVFTARELPIHTDGDPMGHTPVRFSVRRRALKVLVSPLCPPELFVES